VTRAVLAEFTDEPAFKAALEAVQGSGFSMAETLTPYPPPPDEASDAAVRGLIRNALIVGLAVAFMLYMVQFLSSVVDYPIDSGGRPHNNWQVFLPATFEIGVLGASLVGFFEFLRRGRLTRLSDPVLEAPGVERASQDRYFLALTPVEGASDLAMRLGALRTAEVEL
jgi:hypothetical protein